jgi:hypothetical protein
MQMYTDEELMALWAQSTQPIPFARSVLAGEKAPTQKYDVHELMKLTDASRSDGLGNGPSWSSYWRSIIAKRPTAGDRVTASAEGAGTFKVDVSSLLAGRHYGFLVTGNLHVHSRQAADPAVRPHLICDGVRYECEADITVSSATTKSSGLLVTLSASGTSTAMMRFALPETFTEAWLCLTPTKSMRTSITVAELIPPIDFEPATIRDMWHDDDVYFRSESVGGGEGPYEANIAYHANTPSNWKRAEWMSDGEQRFMRGHWNTGKRSIGFHIPIFHPETNAEGRTVAFQYDVRLAPNFVDACREGGKFAGFSSSGKPPSIFPGPNPWPGVPRGRTGELIAGNGGGNVHGDDGWSMRGGFYPGIKTPGHPAQGMVPLHSYAYYLSRKIGETRYLLHEAYRRFEEANGLRGRGYTGADLAAYVLPGERLIGGAPRTGDGIEWDNYPALLVPGEWHRVTQVMHINTPNLFDGWLQAYIDGNMCGDIGGMEWRREGPYRLANSTLGIGNVWFNIYHGGIQYPVAPTWVDLKRLVVKVLEWE